MLTPGNLILEVLDGAQESNISKKPAIQII